MHCWERKQEKGKSKRPFSALAFLAQQYSLTYSVISCFSSNLRCFTTHLVVTYLSDLDVPYIIRPILALLSWRSRRESDLFPVITCLWIKIKKTLEQTSALQISDLPIPTLQKPLRQNFHRGCSVNCAVYNEAFILCERLAIRMQVVT